jgi:hypothetical protein
VARALTRDQLRVKGPAELNFAAYGA